MATTKKLPAKKKSTAVVQWADKLAEMANESAKMESNTGTTQSFGLKGGILTWQDNPLPGNEMAVIIVDSILENVFFEGPYDPEQASSPTCFAYGRDEETMAPHQVVIDAGFMQCGKQMLCDGCEMNEFGSADVGRGKACKNTRRLALIPAGKFDKSGEFIAIEDEDHYANTQLGYMKLPVTSVKGYSAFVKQIAGTLQRPPIGILTRIKVVPDANTQFRVIFEALANVPDELMDTLMARRVEAMVSISEPYVLDLESKSKSKSKSSGKKAQKRKY